MRVSLQARFLALLVAMLLVLFSALAVVLVQQNTTTLRNKLAERSTSFAELATKPIGDTFLTYRQSGIVRIDQQVGKFTDLDKDITGVAIIDSQDKIIFNSNSSQKLIIKPGSGGSFQPQYVKNRYGQLMQIVQPYVEDNGLHRYSMVYTISNDSVNKNIRDTVNTILGACLLALIVTLGLAYLLINRLFLRPVAKVSQAALQISGGDFAKQISLDRSDEIGDLATAVNHMATSLKADITKLQELDTMKSEFMAITAHNLRTPLTIIRNYLELLSEEFKSDPENLKAVNDIQANVRRLEVFAEDVLTVSTIESGQQILATSPLAIQPILEDIITEFKDYARQKKLKFTSSVTADATLKLSKSHFRSAIWNLLDNAAKFTKEGGNVSLEAKSEAGEYIITVADTGIGIDAAEMPKLFTKFHRGTDIMKYNYEGVGIGLYITKLIIEQHGGAITASSEPGKGSRFTISLFTSL